MANEVVVKNRISRIQPQPYNPGGSEGDRLRGGLYGEQYVLSMFPDKKALADDDSYFRCGTDGITIPYVPGVTVAQQGLITSFSDTGPLWVIFNGNKAGGKRVYLDALKLLSNVAPATCLNLELAVRIDTVSKLPTNSNQYTQPQIVNVNGDSTVKSLTTVYAYVAANALVTPASSAAVINAARARIPTGAAVVGDEYTFQFGGVDRSQRVGLTAVRATDVAKLIGDCEPVIIGPQQWATIHLWWITATTNIPSWEWGLNFIER
jgi:hypothetical protein